MENLFATTININNKSAEYQVVFDQEKYIFLPKAAGMQQPSFSFKRENDEWHDQEPMDAELREQAINALETYLLAQL